MRAAYILLAVLVTCGPLLAAESPHNICIDTHYSYQARYLAGQDIVAKALLGHDRRELKISTTCIFLSSANHIALSSEFSCIATGDTVATSSLSGERQSCRITHVEPFVPAAAPAGG